MSRSPAVFLDTSVLVAAVLSSTGGARLLLKLGEAGALRIMVGRRVLAELDGVIERKAPDARPFVALLLDAANVEVGPAPGPDHLAQAGTWLAYAPDAHVLAEALAAPVDYFVTLDRAHFLDNPALTAAPFPLGTPGDCLAWLRARLVEEAGGGG
jgi:predicted nucleic acid-binding protein